MLDRDIHKSILIQILKEIYTDNSLGPLLGFKGGSAAFCRVAKRSRNSPWHGRAPGREAESLGKRQLKKGCCFLNEGTLRAKIVI